MPCSCIRCQLAKADDATLAGLEAAALGLLVKADEGTDLELDADDAECMGTVFGVLGGEIGALGAQDKLGVKLTAEDYRQAAARMQAQLEAGLELLSDSARSRLGPVLDQVNALLAAMSEGNLNAVQAGARMQETLTWVEGQGGGLAEGVYSPYEWSRLARTEAAFARSAAERETYKAEGADDSAVAEHGEPPLHPQCFCTMIAMENSEGNLVIIVETNPDACDACQDWADAIMAAAGF